MWNTSPTYIYNQEYSEGTRLSGADYNTVARQFLSLGKKHSVQYVNYSLGLFTSK